MHDERAGSECGPSIFCVRYLGVRVRHGLRDVRALRLDPITRAEHGIKGADTAIEAGRPSGGATFHWGHHHHVAL